MNETPAKPRVPLTASFPRLDRCFPGLAVRIPLWPALKCRHATAWMAVPVVPANAGCATRGFLHRAKDQNFKTTFSIKSEMQSSAVRREITTEDG